MLGIRIGVNEHAYSREYSQRFRDGASSCSKAYRKACKAIDADLLEPILIRTQEQKDAWHAGKAAKKGLKRPPSMSDVRTKVLLLYSYCTPTVLLL
jgi:hypothetical protein